MSVRLLSNQNVQDSWVETLPVGGRLRVQTTRLDFIILKNYPRLDHYICCVIMLAEKALELVREQRRCIDGSLAPFNVSFSLALVDLT